MLQILGLLLPALIPSWRFFDLIAPSPRIQFVLLKTAQGSSENWREFRPRPAHVSPGAMLWRIFWNPRWNETLFLASCAERFTEKPTDHSLQELRARIQMDIRRNAAGVKAAPYFQFRLIFVHREDTELRTEISYISPVYSL